MKVYELITQLYDVPAGMDAQEALDALLKPRVRRGRPPATRVPTVKHRAKRRRKKKVQLQGVPSRAGRVRSGR